jgi:GNAT superfamily N-acetyltransferase
VTTPEGFEVFTTITHEYLASLPFDLSFQNLEHELADPAREYGPPGGAAFIAHLDDEAVGCVAVREFEPGIAELKRMYVRPAARGHGLGAALAAAAVAEARAIGYQSIRLDTVAAMTVAARIYRSLGFREIERYRENPLETARFYELHFEHERHEAPRTDPDGGNS